MQFLLEFLYMWCGLRMLDMSSSPLSFKKEWSLTLLCN